MLDNGYSLIRMEVLNWGNFHGYQKLDLRADNNDGLLFAPASASAILGINGSGKSTLIDSLMIVLLPFEGSVKLGVTNDAEAGSAGGRTIRDYVLGKHSSTNSITGNQLANTYGRKEGCSSVLLIFKHNRIPNKYISVGRIWWYQNFTVSENQLAFLGYESLSLSSFCQNGQTPRSPKFFKLHCKQTLPQVQTFETMQAYFTALSSSFGNISRDDLKILNRAFYVKSISQIDQFIRENMLLEQENPHLERLLENVRNGREIAFAIENCQKKIKSIDRILKDLKRLQDLVGRRFRFEIEERIFSLQSEWERLQLERKELSDLNLAIRVAQEKLPKVTRALEESQRQHLAIQSQILRADVDSRLQKLDLEINFLNKDTARVEAALAAVHSSAHDLGLKVPALKGTRGANQIQFETRIQEIDLKIESQGEVIEKKREEKFALDVDCKKIREELQHLSEYKTLIPRDLYLIKEEALKNLKIDSARLCFVGELIQIKPEFQSYRRAIESVLFPISRNLLCHPEELNGFTAWLDARGLRSDVTAKRISKDELKGSGLVEIERPDQKFILDMIDILPAENHPFHGYLTNWLRSTFDYRLVEVKEFKSTDGKLVTAEGLVKTDVRTMRKLKQNIQFSLGWDNHEVMAERTAQLVQANAKFSSLTQELQSLERGLARMQDQRRFYDALLTQLPEFLDLDLNRQRSKDLVNARASLLTSNPDYGELRKQEQQWAGKVKELQKSESGLESEIDVKSKRIKSIELLLPDHEREVKGSVLYQKLIVDLGGEDELIKCLEDLPHEWQKRKISRLQYEADLKQNIFQVDVNIERIRSTVAVNLAGYRQDFSDPNLPYELPPSSALPEFVDIWSEMDQRLQKTELPNAQEKWKKFFDQILLDSVKDTINEIKSKIHDVEKSIQSINDVLKLTNFETLLTEERYLKIHYHISSDERIRRFRKTIAEIEKLLGPSIRSQIETQSQAVMETLESFVDELQNEISYRQFVTDVRNHFQFEVQSLRRQGLGQGDEIVEIFSGAKKDAKSSAQTTQLAYTLLASCLAYRFKFHDGVAGQETPRILILDEFGGKFDNEKPKEILKLLDQMGFQSILVSPMSKGDLLAGAVSHMVLVHKVSATHSKVQSYELTSKEDYEKLIRSFTVPATVLTAASAPNLEASVAESN